MATATSVMAVIRTARPNFRNNHDKVAFAIHATFLASGFVLTATGPAALAEDAFTGPFNDEVGVDHWNELNDEYAFVYTNPAEGNKKVLVKCLVLNDKLLVDALRQGSSEPVHLEISVADFVREQESPNYSDRYKNIDNLVKSINENLLCKVDGSPKLKSSSESQSSQTREGSRDHFNEPAGVPTDPSGIVYPPTNPFGGSDLFPRPGAGMYPTRGDFGGDGSMLLGPNDPRWFRGGGGVGGDSGFPGWQPGVPPGARFDPYGPPGVPGFEPGRFARNPRRPGGDGTHPDLEHFRNDSDFI